MSTKFESKNKMKCKWSKATSRFSVLSALSLLLAIGCSKSSDSAPAPIPASPINTSTVVAPQPVTFEHRPWECPRGLVGHWQTELPDGTLSNLNYRFNGAQLIEMSTEESIIDGAMHSAPSRDGMFFWYVGGCRDGRVHFRFWGRKPGFRPVEFSQVRYVRRGFVVTRTIMDGTEFPIETRHRGIVPSRHR